MQFSVSSSYLLKQLQVLGSVINSSTSILDNFFFELDHNELTVSGFRGDNDVCDISDRFY
jgi:DNA polymerase-3 subunit beta